MTVTYPLIKRNTVGTGSLSVFTFSMPFINNNEIEVYVDDVQQSEGSDYTLVNDDPGGTITFTSPPALDAAILIKRVVPLTQTYDYVENDDFPAATHERLADRVVMMAQQIQEQLDRCIQIDEDETLGVSDMTLPSVANRTGKFVSFDANGAVIATDAVVSTTAVSTFMTAFLALDSEEDARAYLEAALGRYRVHEETGTTMKVQVEPGWFFDTYDRVLRVNALQTSGTLVAPSANPRHDIVVADTRDGTISVITGAEAASPADPTIPADKVPLGRINMYVGMTEIADADIEDVRDMSQLGKSDLLLEDDDAGAAAGPLLKLYRNSASPAPSDVGGEIIFSGNDDGGNETQYAKLTATILDETDTTEDGTFTVSTMVGGSLGGRLVVGNGVYTSGATGGDQGADTVNAGAIYDDGVRAGMWELIDHKSGTSVATLDVEDTSAFDSTYVEVRYVIKATVATDDVEIWARFKVGGVYLTSSSYRWSGMLNGDTIALSDNGSTSDTKIALTGTVSINNAVGNDTDEGFWGELVVKNPGDSTRPMQFHYETVWEQTATLPFHFDGWGQGVNAATVTGLRLRPESGNFAQIDVWVYGLKGA